MIKSEERTVYITSDNATWEDKLEAAGHQATLDNANTIELFISTNLTDSKDRHKTSIRKLLGSYEAFKASIEEMKKADSSARAEAVA
jgi:hypothetical protein